MSQKNKDEIAELLHAILQVQTAQLRLAIASARPDIDTSEQAEVCREMQREFGL